MVGKAWLFAMVVSGLALSGAACAQAPVFRFATAEQGRAIVGTRDDFVRALSPFDRAARLKTDKPVTEAAYLEFVSRNVGTWKPEEQASLEAVIGGMRAGFEALSLSWPEAIDVVKTTGLEEGNAPYSRGTAIVIPATILPRGAVVLRKVLPHEVFHVLTRRDPALRKALYATIGFTPCGPVVLPAALRDRKITNPDAPLNEYCIDLTADGKKVRAAPVLYSTAATYDVAKGGEMFAYLEFRFLVVEGEGAGRLLDPGQVSGFLEQVGRNTQYLIHPEEILADNFAILVLGTKGLASPEIVDRMRSVLLTFAKK
jgi:hypothetical protein